MATGPDSTPAANIHLPVPEHCDGLRADVGLTRIIRRLTRSKAQRILKAGVTGHGGRGVKPATKLIAKEVLHWYRKPIPEAPLPAHIPIVWQDDTALALNKPPGLPIHSTARHHEFTVVNYCRRAFGSPPPHPAHRIDMDTSGVLLCYWPPHGPHYKQLFFDRHVSKRYLAIVQGVVAADIFSINVPMALDPTSSVRVRMGVGEGGAPASTEVHVLARGTEATLIEAIPRSGRQHQIRVHLHHVGHPLLGDRLYGQSDDFFRAAVDGLLDPREIVAQTGLGRHALHAWRLGTTHPSGSPLELCAPLPDDMLSYCLTHFGERVLPDGAR